MKTTTKQTHLYSNTDLRKLLIPIIIEQLLSSLMGTIDTMMVSNVGSAAISAVSLVDSINILVIQERFSVRSILEAKNGMEQSVRHNRCFLL